MKLSIEERVLSYKKQHPDMCNSKIATNTGRNLRASDVAAILQNYTKQSPKPTTEKQQTKTLSDFAAHNDYILLLRTGIKKLKAEEYVYENELSELSGVPVAKIRILQKYDEFSQNVMLHNGKNHWASEKTIQKMKEMVEV